MKTAVQYSDFHQIVWITNTLRSTGLAKERRPDDYFGHLRFCNFKESSQLIFLEIQEKGLSSILLYQWLITLCFWVDCYGMCLCFLNTQLKGIKKAKNN